MQKEMRDNWWKQVELISKENAERLAEYRAALSDKRFDQQTKMQILGTYANEFKDLNMMHAAEAGDLQKAQTHLQNSERALNRFDNEITRTSAASARHTHDADYDHYLRVISERYEKQTGHLPANNQELTDARKLLSWEDYLKYTKKVGGTDIKGEPKGFPKPKETPGEQEFKKSFEGLDEFMGGGK